MTGSRHLHIKKYTVHYALNLTTRLFRNHHQKYHLVFYTKTVRKHDYKREVKLQTLLNMNTTGLIYFNTFIQSIFFSRIEQQNVQSERDGKKERNVSDLPVSHRQTHAPVSLGCLSSCISHTRKKLILLDKSSI